MFSVGFPTFRFVNKPENKSFSCRLKREQRVGIMNYDLDYQKTTY